MPLSAVHTFGTAASDGSNGASLPWGASASVLAASDDQYVTAGAPGSNLTQYLKLTNPNPTEIGDDDAIQRIIIRIERAKQGAGLGYVRDETVQPVVNGAISGVNQANLVDDWPIYPDGVAVYDLSASAWGVPSLRGADVKAPNFGMVIAARNTWQAGGAIVAAIDYVDIQFDYAPASSVPFTAHGCVC